MLQIVLLAGKFVFLIILYLFLYRVIRSSTRELRGRSAPAKQPAYPASALLRSPGCGRPRHACRPGAVAAQAPSGRLVVEKSPVLRCRRDRSRSRRACPSLVGRSSDMDIHLEDTFVSSKHALFEVTPRACCSRTWSAPMEPK